MTFYGTQFFKTPQGEEVRYATKLLQPIDRTPDSDPLPFERLFRVLYYITIGVLVVILILGAFGTLLPLWMFVNSM